MRKYWKWTALALVVVGAAALGVAQMKGHGFGPGAFHRHMMGRIAKYLELTDAQKAEIKTMIQAEKPKALPLAQQLANGRKQMIALTANGKFDEAQVRALANQQAQILAQLMVEKEKVQSDIYNKVLTPEQRTKADQWQQKRTARIDQWLQHLSQNDAGTSKE